MTEATSAFKLVGVGTPPATEAVQRSSGLDQLAKYIVSRETAVPRQAEKIIKDIAKDTENGLLLIFNASRQKAVAVRLPEKVNKTPTVHHFDVPADLPNIREAVAMTVRMQSVDKYPGVAVIEKYNEPDEAFTIRVTSINAEALTERNDPLLSVIRKTQAELNRTSASS